jgi:ABC-2 type transport system permease protein
MIPLLRAELLKLRTTRTFLALTAVTVVTSALLAGVAAYLTKAGGDGALVDVFTSDTSGLFVLVLAIVGITGEWRHRTIAGALLAVPDRVRFLAAKTLAYAVAGAVLSLAVSVAITVVGVVVLEWRGVPLPAAGALVEQYARNGFVALLMGGLGVGIGAVARNQAAGIVAALVLLFVIEPAVIGFVPEAGRFGPFGALPLPITDVPPEAVGMGDLDVVPGGVAALLMLAWIGAVFAAGAALLRRRDVSG